jgi:group I intron endonuclease
MCELYKIIFPNGKLYFGMSINALRRFKGHIKSTTNKSKLPVHNAMRKYGVNNCKVMIICVGSTSYIAKLEQWVIAKYQTQSRKFGYNVCIGGEVGPMTGRGHSQKSRRKMSMSQRVRIRTEEELARLATYGRYERSPETRAKNGASMVARHARGEIPLDTPAQLAAFEKGRLPRPCKEKTKIKLSKIMSGRPGKYYYHSPEAIQRASASRKKCWKQKRAESIQCGVPLLSATQEKALARARAVRWHKPRTRSAPRFRAEAVEAL